MKVINYRNVTYSEVEKIISELKNKGLELDQITMRVYEYVISISDNVKYYFYIRHIFNVIGLLTCW